MLKHRESRADALKNNTAAFLECERMCSVIQEAEPTAIPFDGSRIEKNQRSENLNDLSTKTKNVYSFATTEERIKTHAGSPQRYKTTCFFQPRQHPVRYSETVIVNIGSTKKKYYETIYSETKLEPVHWQESMTTLTPAALLKTEINIPMKEDYHYISLEPQQPKLIEATI